MSRREKDGKFAQQYSAGSIALAWLLGLIGLVATYFVGRFLANDLGAFRSCSHNTGLAVVSCGKQGLDGGDVLIILIFLASIAICVGLFARAWSMSRRRA